MTHTAYHKDRHRDRVALVTGGARGIGLATARRLALEGACVTIADIDEAALDDAQAELAKMGLVAATRRLDVTSAADWQATLSALETDGDGLDLLVNNAARESYGSIEDADLSHWRDTFSVTLDSIYLGVHVLLPLISKGKGGAIVNVSSLAAHLAMPYGIAYGTAKSALLALTRSVAAYCGKRKYAVRCNAVLPGFIETRLLDLSLHGAANLDETKDRLIRQTPAQRLGVPDDIAAAIAFLCADEASFISGHALVVDGGYSARGI